MSHPLDGAQAKIDRSLYHLHTLHEEQPDPAIYANAITFRQEFDPDAKTITIFFDRIPDIPVNWALIAADALQNLRTALNYVAWELAVLHLARTKQQREPVYKTEFPIADTAAKFRNDYVVDIDPVHVAKIKDMQPYGPPFMARVKAQLAVDSNIDPASMASAWHPLAQLRDLTNRDKHRALRLLFLGTSLQDWGEFRFTDCKEVFGHITPVLQLAPNTECFRFDIRVEGPNPKAHMNPTLVPRVAFDLGPPMLTTIENAGGAVQYVVNEFRSVF
jgi:hypothetical protein